MLAAHTSLFSKVLAAHKKNLTTARAHKNKHSARMLRVSNGPIQIESARKILPLLELFPKIR